MFHDNKSQYDPMKSNPIGRGIFYLCEECGDRLDSAAEHAVACSCRNVVIDVDAGRISVKRPEKAFIVYEE